jgi:hypothetical protein
MNATQAEGNNDNNLVMGTTSGASRLGEAEEGIRVPFPKRADPSRYGRGWFEIPPGFSVADVLSQHRLEPEKPQPAGGDGFCEEPFSLRKFGDPEWDYLGERGQVSKLLFEAGLKSKAYRFALCHRTGIPYDCRNRSCESKFYTRYHCDCRFCKYCGPLLFNQLRDRYSVPISCFLENQRSHSGYTLARLNFTMKSDGSLPTRAMMQALNRAIRRTLKVAIPRGESRRLAYGVLWVDEFGYERRGRKKRRTAQGLNPHAHALYYGPRIDWARVRDAWSESLRLEGLDGQGFWVTFLKGWQRNPGLVVKRALSHMLKYVSKIPAETPERIAALEVGFNGVRRVHAGGLFYKLAKSDDHLQEDSLVCLDCGKPLHRADGCKPWETFPVDFLEGEGRRDLAEAWRVKNRVTRAAIEAALRLYGGGP